MKESAGIWMDYEKAYIALVSPGGEEITLLPSGVEGRIRTSGGSRSRTPYGPQDVVSESKVRERRDQQLKKYYQEVLQELANADKILIFGPGMAKTEFYKEARKSKKLAAKIVGVETTDKMTEKQIVAKVREFFAPDLLTKNIANLRPASGP